MKPLVEYWGTKYDWRKAEAKLNALPQFVSNNFPQEAPQAFADAVIEVNGD